MLDVIKTQKDLEKFLNMIKHDFDKFFFDHLNEFGEPPVIHIDEVFADELIDALEALNIRFDYYTIAGDKYIEFILYPHWAFDLTPPNHSAEAFLYWIEKNFGIGGLVNYTPEFRQHLYKLIYDLATHCSLVELDSLIEIINALKQPKLQAEVADYLADYVEVE